jgi:hypothetical protein
MTDYTKMTRLEAIRTGGIVAEVDWLKANALTLDLATIKEAHDADILGVDDYEMILRARRRQEQPITEPDAGFGGQDITYEREPCPLSARFPSHLPGKLEGCTCYAE